MISSAWRERLVALAAVTASAIAFTLCAQIDWPWLMLDWVGLVPWLAVLDRSTSLRGALALSLLMCVAFVLGILGWLVGAIQNYTGAPWAVTVLVVLLAAPLLEPQFIAFALARHLARRHAVGAAGFWRTTLAGACVYVGAEWAFPKLFADTLGLGLYPSVLMRQAADLAGIPGLTFVLVIANECVLAVLRAATGTLAPSNFRPLEPQLRTRVRQALPPAACVAALVLALLAYGTARSRQLNGDTNTAAPVTTGIVQADISQYNRLATELGTFEAVRLILDAHFALSAEALQRGDLDLLVWPETVYPTTFGSPKSEDGAAFDKQIAAFVSGTGVPLVFGAYDVDGADEFNAAVFLEPSADGRLTFDSYRKAWLFPLTERVPAWLDFDLVRTWMPWLGTWKPGGVTKAIALSLRDGRTIRLAPLICYDALDSGHVIAMVRQGAELIVTISNDSWFSYGNVPRSILVISAFRSIETRRPQVRATTTGISAVISPTGELVGTLGLHQRANLVETVTPARGTWTLMLAWGDWFGPIALALGIALLLASLSRRPRVGD